ncbi:MAG TPA: YetF domain-containing protein [Thermoanaerobaculia bacterium]
MEMGEAVLAAVRHLLGIDVPPTELTLGQVTARAVVVYAAGLAILRLGEHRFLGKNTAFDVVLGFILGSMLSRAVNGSAALGPTLAGCVALVALHWLFAAMALRSHRFGHLIKGGPRQLVRDGEIDWRALRRNRITRRDLEEAVRSQGKRADLADVDEAYFERSGQISVIPRRGEPRVVEVEVADGVQTVRLVVE